MEWHLLFGKKRSMLNIENCFSTFNMHVSLEAAIKESKNSIGRGKKLPTSIYTRLGLSYESCSLLEDAIYKYSKSVEAEEMLEEGDENKFPTLNDSIQVASDYTHLDLLHKFVLKSVHTRLSKSTETELIARLQLVTHISQRLFAQFCACWSKQDKVRFCLLLIL